MPLIGGELDQLSSLKATFDREGAMVADILSTIRTQLGNTYWEGPAALRFRESWQSDFEPMLQRLQTQLSDAATEVARRREALMQAGS